jgi:hypothetical protein
MPASDHRWKSTRAAAIVNNTWHLAAEGRNFWPEYQTLTIIPWASLVRGGSDRE